MTAHRNHLTAPPETLDDDPLVTAVMSAHLVAITPDAPLSIALQLMASTGVRHLPVVDGRRCRGVVVEADLVRFLAQVPGPLADPRPLVGELARLTRPIPDTARRSDAAHRMQAEGCDAVLVTTRGQLTGIVTATDLIRSLAAGPEDHTGQSP